MAIAPSRAVGFKGNAARLRTKVVHPPSARVNHEILPPGKMRCRDHIAFGKAFGLGDQVTQLLDHSNAPGSHRGNKTHLPKGWLIHSMCD